MKNIRIEEIGDISAQYRYLEVFFDNTNELFLRITISEERKLRFNFFSIKEGFILSEDEMSSIIDTAKFFLPKALKDEDDFNEWVAKK